jgi:hypothetical protein
VIRFLADENFNGKILRGLRRKCPDADILRAQDTLLYQSPDPLLLAWAAQQGCIVLTHDVETMVGYAFERVAAGLPMPGLIVVRDNLAWDRIIEDLATVLEASDMPDWENRVIFVPF